MSPATVKGSTVVQWWGELQARWQEAFGENAPLLGNLLLAVLVTLAAVILYRLVRLVYGGAAIRIAGWLSRRVGALRFQNQELLSAEEVNGVFVGVWRVAGLGLFLLGLYVYLQVAFGIFPQTEHLAEGLLDYLTLAGQTVLDGIIGFIPNLVFLIVLFFVARWALRLIKIFFNGITTRRIRIPGFYPEFADPSYKILRVVIIAFGVVIAFPYLPGSSSPAFRGISIFLGVLVSLGSTGAVTNFISGLTLTYMRAFSVGDRVRIADAQGEVV